MAEPLNATFFAFRKRERGGVLVQTSIAFALVGALLIAAFVALVWGSAGTVITWYGQIIAASATNDTTAIQNLGFPTEIFQFFGVMVLWLFPFYILCAAYEAACLRWMIHGETQGFMGLSLGAPTWRVWSCYWMWFLLNIALSMVMSMLSALLMGAIVIGSGDPMSTVAAMLGVNVLQYVIMAYFAIRFAPGAAASVARRKFSFFEAWTVTKGRFFALFGSFLLLWVIYIVFSLALTAAWVVFAMGTAPIDFGALSDPARAETAFAEWLQAYLQTLMQPQAWGIMIALWVVGSIGALVFYVACYGVNARAALAAIDEGKIQPAQAG
ncbi:MAG: hypothetical protein M0D54_12635 [Hyphomonadaceae bacterium JAD_PAG50586_4]|nr:MAG: hypothetical protein M0D54_12635 [Hyphomonadaceae bacterium JAD_PAG50586_4]